MNKRQRKKFRKKMFKKFLMGECKMPSFGDQGLIIPKGIARRIYTKIYHKTPANPYLVGVDLAKGTSRTAYINRCLTVKE